MLSRWSGSSRWYLAGSIALALLTALRVHGYVAAAAAASSAHGPSVAVVVAARDVPRGAVLSPTDLRLTGIPRAYAPPGAVDSIDRAAGRVVLAGLATGEVVTDTRLARVRAGPVASLVPPGLRAFAVPTSLPAGALTPGDRVDVLATFGSGHPHTEVVAPSVEVLLVLGARPPGGTGGGGGALDLAATRGAPVTLLVLIGPEDEERLAFARAGASLDVAIAPAEPSAAESEGVAG